MTVHISPHDKVLSDAASDLFIAEKTHTEVTPGAGCALNCSTGHEMPNVVHMQNIRRLAASARD